MSKETVLDMVSVLEEIRSQLAVLAERVGRLEGEARVPAPAAAAAVAEKPSAPSKVEPAVTEVPTTETIPEDVLLAISAAVAAFLGERAHIRRIRLISSTAWAQQGRVSIQASHSLH